MKQDLIEFNVKCIVNVKFDKYDKRAMNNKAKRTIRRWLKELLEDRHISMYIEFDETGAAIEARTQKIKVKVK
jgi:hypothetical protein